MTGAAWGLPTTVMLGGKSWALHTDYRDILGLLDWLDGARGAELSEGQRWFVALRLFYPAFEEMDPTLYPEAVAYLADFLAGGHAEPAPRRPKLLDWQKDAPMIVAGVNKAAGCEVRALPYLHWWSFLAWFSSIGEGTLATVVGIRDKLRRGKSLEKWELEFYRTHRAEVDLRPSLTEVEKAEKARLEKMLAG